MAKAQQSLKGLKKVAEKVVHCDVIRTNIPAGMAMAGPPLGTTLGQRGINVAAFCKEFNDKTRDMKEGIPLPARIRVHADRTYTLGINMPPVTFFLKQAAGITRGSMGNEIAGKITVKHVYEIAKIKQQDPFMKFRSLEEICKMTIDIARSCGIEIVHKLDPQEYREFLDQHKLVVEEQKKELQLKREAKMLRAEKAAAL